MSNFRTSPEEHSDQQKKFQNIHTSLVENMSTLFGPSGKTRYFVMDNILNYNTSRWIRSGFKPEAKKELDDAILKLERVNTLLTDPTVSIFIKQEVKKEMEEIHDRLQAQWNNISTIKTPGEQEIASDNYEIARDEEIRAFLTKRGSRTTHTTENTKRQTVETLQQQEGTAHI